MASFAKDGGGDGGPSPSDRAAPAPREASLPVGVVLRRDPGATEWVKWRWSVAALLPGAGPVEGAGKVLLEEPGSGVLETHAATTPLTLHRADVEGYRVSLAMTPPSVFVALRHTRDPDEGAPPEVHLVTASAYEAQDYADCDEEIVEAVPISEALEQWIAAFVEAHWRDEQFVKRQRDRYEPEAQDGKGDARVRQTADVFRAPGALKPAPARGFGSGDVENEE